MRLRTILGAAVLGVGAVAVGNSTLRRRAGDLEPALPGRQRTYRWRGMDIAYTELGESDNPDVVLFHGINAAGTSHEFEPIVEGLSRRYHVLAPDLPGFGRSDRPPIEYDAGLYTDFVGDFADDTADDPACIASSLTASYAALAHQQRGCFSRLVLICPTTTTMSPRRPRLRTLLRAPLVGTGLFNLMTSERAIRHFSADHGYYDPDAITPETVAYRWQTSHQTGARFAPASFFAGYLDPDAELEAVLAAIEVPVTLVWGREAEVTPLSDGQRLAETADVRLVVFDNALLLPHVEHAEQFLDLLERELSRAEH